jgi:hypothetical protein
MGFQDSIFRLFATLFMWVGLLYCYSIFGVQQKITGVESTNLLLITRSLVIIVAILATTRMWLPKKWKEKKVEETTE